MSLRLSRATPRWGAGRPRRTNPHRLAFPTHCFAREARPWIARIMRINRAIAILGNYLGFVRGMCCRVASHVVKAGSGRLRRGRRRHREAWACRCGSAPARMGNGRESGNPAAGYAEHVKKIVPKRFGLCILTAFVFPFFHKSKGAGFDFIPT